MPTCPDCEVSLKKGRCPECGWNRARTQYSPPPNYELQAVKRWDAENVWTEEQAEKSRQCLRILSQVVDGTLTKEQADALIQEIQGVPF